MEKIIDGTNENLREEIEEDYISRFRLIPFSSLGKQNGMLIGFKPDKIIVKFDESEKEWQNVIVRNL